MLKIVHSLIIVGLLATASFADHFTIFQPGKLKPIDSELKVKVGDAAPGFTLSSIQGKKVSLSDFKGKKNVIISFIPAAWTPVCSDQWPGYNIAKDMVAQYDALFVGISVDNIPTLWSWSEAMNTLTFPVLSDFWPHGKVADTYGVLRSDGTAERALFIVDKNGIIRFAYVSDINERPNLKMIMEALGELK